MRLALFLALLPAVTLAAPDASPVSAPGLGAVPDADPTAQAYSDAVQDLLRDRQTARAFVDLIRLEQLEDQLADLTPLAKVYRQIADDRKTLPEVRNHALYLLARLEQSRGNRLKAAADLRQLGFVEDWQIIGPFDDEGKHGWEKTYPPEQAQDLSAHFPGKVRTVAWRRLPAEARVDGFVHLGAVIRPTKEVVVYAVTTVDSPREQRAFLRVGASGAVRILLNGAQVLADAAYHPARLDQAGVAVTLHRGPNRLLVKLCHAEGRMGFLLRLTEPDGDPLVATVSAAAPLPALHRASARPEPLDGVVAMLERRASGAHGEAEAAARGDLALALAARRNFEPRDRRASVQARRAAALLPSWSEALLLAARLEEEDPNRRRKLLEDAVAAGPKDAGALTALGLDELLRSRPERAALLFERAVAAAPGYLPAREGLARAHEQAGLTAQGLLEELALERTFPTKPGAVLAAARAARQLERFGDAGQLMRKALALRYDDEGTRAGLAQILVDQGDVDGAVLLLDEALRLDPSELSTWLRKAELLAANGRTAEAEASFAAAERLAPEEADVFEHRGRVRLRAGKRSEALADLQRALELRPQNPQLKELVRSVAPERQRFEAPYVLDARALLRAAPAPGPDDDALVLGELKVTRVFPSGLSATFNQTVVKVLTQRGADAFRTQTIGYSPDRQEIRVERARVIKPDGTTVETYQEQERSASEPWYRLYYDTRARSLTFPALAPGDLLELSYRQEDVASENLLSDYFGDMTFLGDGTRKARLDYVLLMPEGRKIWSSSPDVPNLTRTEKAVGGGVTEYRWSARDLPRIAPEPGMPGWSEVSPYIHVSTYADWNQVASFYWGLIREQLKPNDEVRATAARIAASVRGRPATGGDPEELRIVKAVYDFVVTSTRYVGLEFGIHGFKPYRVDQILTRRFGDCKDKASLTHALLESLGIDSRIVLLRMKRLGRIPETPASLAVFNHAILYVPKYDLWLDGTASYSGSGDLPGEDRGAAVLVVNPGEPAHFGYIPSARPEQNRVQTRFEVQLQLDGSALIRGSSRVLGVSAPGYRQAYQAENERRAAFEQAFSRTFPGLEVQEVSLSDLSRLEDDVALRFTLKVTRYSQRDSSTLSFTPFNSGRTYTESYAPLSTRRHDLVAGEPFDNLFQYAYQLPPGVQLAELPEPVVRDAPFASFEVRYQRQEHGFLAEAHLTLKAGRIRTADYPAFRAFLGQLDRALARKVRIILPSKTSPTVIPAHATGAP